MKYEIKKVRTGGSYHNMNFGEDFKTIEKSKLKIHLENGWQIVRPIYPIITYLSDSWSKLTLSQRITIAGIILTILITVIVA